MRVSTIVICGLISALAFPALSYTEDIGVGSIVQPIGEAVPDVYDGDGRVSRVGDVEGIRRRVERQAIGADPDVNRGHIGGGAAADIADPAMT
jgi:hypothetical protein